MRALVVARSVPYSYVRLEAFFPLVRSDDAGAWPLKVWLSTCAQLCSLPPPSQQLASKSWGNLIAVIDPEMLGSAAEFRERVETVLGRVKGAKPVPGGSSVFLPGERGNQCVFVFPRTSMFDRACNAHFGIFQRVRSDG